MPFGEALDILGGSSAAPPPAMPDSAPTSGAPLRLTVRPQGRDTSSPVGSFGGALDILSGNAASEPQKETPKRNLGGMESFATGLKSGLTANFSDEIAGASAAGRSMLPDEAKNVKLSPLGEIISAAGGAMRMGYEALAGGDTGSQAYTKARDAERENQRLAAEQHPVANAAGNITGALALPIGGAASVATLPGRMAAGAGLGAGMGAAYGAGEGETLADRASRAGTGALIGGATGGVAPAILTGIGKTAGAVSDTAGSLLGHPLQTIRGLRNSDDEAARRIGTSLIGDIQSGRAGMTAADLRAAEHSGQPTALIDMGGENTRALARSAANTSPQGRAALENLATERFTTQNDRASDFIRSLVPRTSGPSEPASARLSNVVRSFTGGTRNAEQIELIKDAARKANGPAYAKAYQAGDKQIWTSELERLTSAPYVQSALRSAISKWKNYVVRDGYGSFNPPFKVEDGPYGIIKSSGGAGLTAHPNLQLWDYAARQLQDKARSAPPGSESAKLYNDLARAMKDELDKVVPEYKSAREGAAQFFGARNAVDAGKEFASLNTDIGLAKIAHAKMSDAEKQLFEHGYAQELLEKLSKSGDGSSPLNSPLLTSKAGREKMEIALGPVKAAQFRNALEKEKITTTFGGAENPLDAGKNFISSQVPMDAARVAHARMNPAQKAEFAEGFASDLANHVSKISDNKSITIDRIFNSPDGRARIDLALGKDKAKDLEYFMRRENMIDMARKALGNSTTARQYMELGLAGGLGGAIGGTGDAMISGHMDVKTLISAAVLGGALAGHRAVNFKVAQRVGEMLASSDPKVLVTAIKMVKTNPDAGRAVLRAEKIMEKLSGQGAGSAPPMLPAITSGRADEQQQQ